MRDAGLGVLGDHVRHGDRRGLAARAGRRGHGDERLERSRDRHAATDGLVHVVQQRGRVAGQEVDGLPRVDRAPAAHRHEAVDLLGAGVVGGLLHGAVRRLDLDAVEDVRLDPLLVEERADALGNPEGGESGIGDDQDLPEPQAAGVEADLVRRAQAELDRGHLHDEHGLGRQRDTLHGAPSVAVCFGTRIIAPPGGGRGEGRDRARTDPDGVTPGAAGGHPRRASAARGAPEEGSSWSARGWPGSSPPGSSRGRGTSPSCSRRGRGWAGACTRCASRSPTASTPRRCHADPPHARPHPRLLRALRPAPHAVHRWATRRPTCHLGGRRAGGGPRSRPTPAVSPSRGATASAVARWTRSGPRRSRRSWTGSPATETRRWAEIVRGVRPLLDPRVPRAPRLVGGRHRGVRAARVPGGADELLLPGAPPGGGHAVLRRPGGDRGRDGPAAAGVPPGAPAAHPVRREDDRPRPGRAVGHRALPDRRRAASGRPATTCIITVPFAVLRHVEALKPFSPREAARHPPAPLRRLGEDPLPVPPALLGGGRGHPSAAAR